MSFLPFFSLETWILLITSICLFAVYGNWTYGIFEKMGIPGPKPVMYFGTLGRHNKVYYVADSECAQKYGKLWGMYEFRRPMLAVMDPDLLKGILVKECFTYFTNRRNFLLNGDLYDSISIAEDDQWRRIRHILSPCFTSGRIKEMFNIMKHHSSKLITHLQPKAQNGDVITMKGFFGPYSMDVIAGCMFSVEMDSSALISHASKLFKFPIALFMFQAFFPALNPLLKFLGFSFFPKKSTNFFKAIVEKMRAERNGRSGQNGQLGHKSDDILQTIVSQVTLFAFGGYETSATTLVFLAYHLARNPEVMKCLQEEIDSTFPDKGPVTYEALMEMEYLDSVVSECMRIHCPVGRLERVAKETVKINGITIPKNMLVMIPIYALHRDPEFWPDPEEFKPDRFSKQNKQRINPYTYLPFGIGPRNCIGMRFALVIVKLALVEVLQNYSLSVCKETEFPLTMHLSSLVEPLNPIKLKLATR
uniref:unspecific monooxygenase n=1 Tax=Mola mola TaxID=94237 RepID=A0A3Q4AK07_MOLML